MDWVVVVISTLFAFFVLIYSSVMKLEITYMELAILILVAACMYFLVKVYGRVR